MKYINLVSSEWTDEDRLAVVNIIAYEISQEKLLTEAKSREWSERLNFLATATSEFLEANRQGIIGNDIEKHE